ncbi:PDR/VanB family oxidoreductase [Vitreoscilla stercoraria]|uniref:PDR/VanB family oxidoreductase n=1 Tax=Vitreoscilla stercoraria TaxID=61 RepID=A0ABY4EGJ2_VITST|nr:PDR/VanB family oxidoreductase [Vitreoscilla stercoraria]UOO92517.1 PDR/VanB family oxidoreductase [Vitreoscilla stercoraria]
MTMTVLVERTETLCNGIKLLQLIHPEGQNLPTFEAGAHIDVHLGNSLMRQYSLCNSPSEQHRYHIAVLEDAQSRGGSQYVHQHIQAGQTLQISAPRNVFSLAQTHSKAVLLAGGIGITPLLAMAEQFLVNQVDFQLVYCCKSPEHIAFTGRLSQPDLRDKVVFVHDDLISHPELLQAFLPSAHEHHHLYTCGPNGFMQTVFAQAKSIGWQDAQLHQESFKADLNTQTHRHFQIQIASSGDVFDIPATQSITQTLEENGYFIPVSCEQGVCGTCITHVIEGEIEHCDQFLTEEEKASNKIFTPCCSRAKSDLLVLDL